MRILLVDDDEIFSELLKANLVEQNYVVDVAEDGIEGWDYIEASNYDLIVLDVMLPKLDGISFCRKLRAKGLDVPVLLLTARGVSDDKIVGLDAGADDYAVKSISLPELEARIRALLRRKTMTASLVLTWGDLQLDPSLCEVKFGEILLNLTAKEYGLLELFMQSSQKIHSQTNILSKLWSLEDEPPGPETVRALIKRLRQKLKPVGASDLIETVYGMGYRLNPAFQKPLPNKINIPIASIDTSNQQHQTSKTLNSNIQNKQSEEHKSNLLDVDVLKRALQDNVTLPHIETHKLVDLSKKPEAKVMVVDDDKLVSRLVRTLLEPWGLQVTILDNPQQLWEELDAVIPDLLILDVQMPDVDGIELCKIIRNNSKWAWLPILFLTGQRDALTIQNVFAAGGDDYVSKPVVAPELITRIFNRLERVRLLREQAEIDTLTGLPNRHRSSQDIDKFIYLASQYQQPFCMAVVTLDKLSQINRDYGHRLGDQMLRKLAQLLRQELRNEDVVSRWNGAEFIIGMYGLSRGEGIDWLALVLESLRQIEFSVSDIEENNIDISATFSAGVAQYPEDGKDIQSLYKQAVSVLEQAKVSGYRVLPATWQPLKTHPLPLLDVILLHRDSEFAHKIMGALEIRGYHAHWLQDGQRALSLAGNSPSLYGKVILLEDDLPNVNGLDLLKEFKRCKVMQRTKVLWLATQTHYVETALKLGCFDYINVPCNVSAFMHRLRHLL
ncbi:response regulator receiver modulated diguanylate cyclase [Calothrix sp. NIES-4071]|nr:response regulator receiver modulated diguanylate cyclase [Calothrix sp. NIES-4071]BAZ59970.1 response regulator receiver modulated diguanylate cyclase [Calothrix sp. NIES-4105]